MTDLLTTTQAADIAGVRRDTISKAIQRGALPAERILGRWAIKPADLDAWLKDASAHKSGWRKGKGRRRTNP